MEKNSSLVKGRNIVYDYPDGTTGIKDVTLDICRGERVVVLGPNGSGKSTLLMLLGGLLEPDRGSIRYKGSDPSEYKEEIGVFVQDPDDFLFNPTVKQELLYEINQMDIDEITKEERVNKYVKEFSLSDYLNKPPFRLSDGEKKRVMLASLLIPDPEVLYLDEPFSSLDPCYRKEFIQILNQQNEVGKTIVLATQKIDLVPYVCDRVILLSKDTGIAKIGDPRSILYNKELLRENNLDVPEIVEVAEKLGIEEQKPLSLKEIDYEQ